MMISSDHGTLGLARGMRSMPTEAERVVWRMLRGRRFLAWKFRRQVPIGPYIADFLCFEARLVVEVDGGQHAENSRDVARDRWFEAEGFRVLRLWNHEVLKTPEAALDAVYAALEPVCTEGTKKADSAARAPSSGPSGHLLPRGEKGRLAAPSATRAATTARVDGTTARLLASPLLPSREQVPPQGADEGARAAQRASREETAS